MKQNVSAVHAQLCMQIAKQRMCKTIDKLQECGMAWVQSSQQRWKEMLTYISYMLRPSFINRGTTVSKQSGCARSRGGSLRMWETITKLKECTLGGGLGVATYYMLGL